MTTITICAKEELTVAVDSSNIEVCYNDMMVEQHAQ